MVSILSLYISLTCLARINSAVLPVHFKNIQGGKNKNFDFNMGPNTGAYFSCSATLNGEMFVFGGETNHKTQV